MGGIAVARIAEKCVRSSLHCPSIMGARWRHPVYNVVRDTKPISFLRVKATATSLSCPEGSAILISIRSLKVLKKLLYFPFFNGIGRFKLAPLLQKEGSKKAKGWGSWTSFAYFWRWSLFLEWPLDQSDLEMTACQCNSIKKISYQSFVFRCDDHSISNWNSHSLSIKNILSSTSYLLTHSLTSSTIN